MNQRWPPSSTINSYNGAGIIEDGRVSHSLKKTLHANLYICEGSTLVKFCQPTTGYELTLMVGEFNTLKFRP